METPDILFGFLRDVLYNPAAAKLDTDQLDDDYKKLGEGLKFMAQCIDEQRDFTTDLSRGILTGDVPPHTNPFAAPLKALHASLRHLTWTSQQVAKGDYNQRVDFMGEFAEAFNTMTEQLKNRQEALQEENRKNIEKSVALEQSYDLLEQVTRELQQWIVIMECEQGEILFENREAHTAFPIDRTVVFDLQDYLAIEKNSITSNQQHEVELENEEGDRVYYFSVVSYPMNWKSKPAVAHVVTDVSDEKRQLQKLENVAYQDNLTGVNNRYYGMQTLREWIDDRKDFCLVFIDLDNLKFVNDNFGHNEGDKYIIGAAQLLQRTALAGEVCRLGGDEFMMLLPNAKRDALEAVMEAARNTMIEDGKADGRPYMCSLSYGVVEIQGDTHTSASEVLSVADERMYAYKRKHKMGRGMKMDPDAEQTGDEA